MAVLAALFGGMRVLLSCLGLYGLVAQVMSRRTSEIAVRIALGATRIESSGWCCARVFRPC